MANLTKLIQLVFLSRNEIYTASIPDDMINEAELQSTVSVNGTPQAVHFSPGGTVDPEADGNVPTGTRTARGGKTVAIYAQYGTREADALAAATTAPIPPLPATTVPGLEGYPTELLADVDTPNVTAAHWPVTLGTVWGHVDWVSGTNPDLDALLAGLLVQEDSSQRPYISVGSPLAAADLSDITQRDCASYYSASPTGTPSANGTVVGTPLSVSFRYAGAFGADANDVDGTSAVATRVNGALTVSCDGPTAQLATLQSAASSIAATITQVASR